MKTYWIFSHFLPTLGFLLALILFLHLLKERRSPSSTIAWLLAIVLVPYVGVPLYILWGGRKMKKMTGKKEIIPYMEKGTPIVKSNHAPVIQGLGDSTFSLRKGNSVQILASGEEAFHNLMESIEAARKSIYITTFILGTDTTGKAIISALAGKAREGVTVCLLLDALGSYHITDHFLSDYKAAGGNHAFFMPMFHFPFRGRANLRNHRKMVIVDRKTAIIGGMNLTCEYMGESSDSHRWHDLSLAVQGPIVDDLFAVFHSDWKFATKLTIPFEEEVPDVFEGDESIPLQLVPSGPDVNEDPLYDTVLASLFNARKRIWIVTPYFIPDEMLLKALCIASRHNVDVRIIVPLLSNHRLADLVRRNYLQQVVDSGGHVYQFRPGMLHGKLIIIDNSLGIVGSMNMDVRSFFLNYEIALFIHSRDMVFKLNTWIYGLMRDSETVLKKQSVFVEYIEGFARLLAPLL